MAIDQTELDAVALIRSTTRDGESHTLRSADEVIKLIQFSKSTEIGCDKTKRQQLMGGIFGNRAKSRYFPNS